MAYKVETVTDIAKALDTEYRNNYTYALVYGLSEVKLCEMRFLKDSDLKECREARFFSVDKEFHLFETEEGMAAVVVTEEDGTDYILKKYELAPKFSEAGNVLLVKEYLDYDEDGQAVVGLTRMVGLE